MADAVGDAEERGPKRAKRTLEMATAERKRPMGNLEWRHLAREVKRHCGSERRITAQPLMTAAKYFAKQDPPSALERGFRIMENIDAVAAHFTSTDFHLSDMQAQVFETIKYAMCVSIFGDAYAANEMRILEHYGIQQIDTQQAIAIQTARRQGKTTIVGFSLGCFLYGMPNMQACVFSPSQNQSNQLLAVAKGFILKHFPDCKFEDDATHKKSIRRGKGDLRVVEALSSAVDVSLSLSLSLSRLRLPTF